MNKEIRITELCDAVKWVKETNPFGIFSNMSEMDITKLFIASNEASIKRHKKLKDKAIEEIMSTDNHRMRELLISEYGSRVFKEQIVKGHKPSSVYRMEREAKEELIRELKAMQK